MGMMRIGCAVLAVLLAFLPVRLCAQAEGDGLSELVQELFLAETVYPQGAGEVQLTVDARFQDETAARLLAEYGITDRLQLSAATPYLQSGGAGDEVQVGVLYNLVNGPRAAASLSLEVAVPTDSDDAEVEWEPALIVAGHLGMVQLHASMAAGITREQTELSPALGLMLDAGRITPTLELTSTLAEGETPETALTPGLFVHLTPHLEAGVGAPIDLHAATLPDAMLLVTLEF
jgi:hypothetical protein